MIEAAPPDPLHGIDKYRAIKEIGRGGMGEVYLAEHVNLGTKVVIKLLHAELVDKTVLVDRMRLEAQALARLVHPNLVRVTDFDRTPGGRPYFVMEFLPGRSLREEAAERGGYLPVGEALELVRQACAGLGYAHEHGLVHRDIKLDNLFVCDAPSGAGATARTVKILDFGVAKLLHGAGEQGPAPLAVPTRTGMVVGTPRFFAPEQARGHKLDHRADIYSLGLVLYALVAGRGPFDDAQTVTDMAKAHVLRQPDPPSRFAPQPIPPGLDAVVLRCLAKSPEDRYASAGDLGADLERIARAHQPGSGPLDVSGSELPTTRQRAERPSPDGGAFAPAAHQLRVPPDAEQPPGPTRLDPLPASTPGSPPPWPLPARSAEGQAACGTAAGSLAAAPPLSRPRPGGVSPAVWSFAVLLLLGTGAGVAVAIHKRSSGATVAGAPATAGATADGAATGGSSMSDETAAAGSHSGEPTGLTARTGPSPGTDSIASGAAASSGRWPGPASSVPPSTTAGAASAAALGTVAGSPGSGVPATPPPAKGSLIRKHATW